MTPKINFIFPSMSRPKKYFDTLDNLKKTCLAENYEVVCVLDVSDTTMNNDAVKSRIKEYPFVREYFINTTGKIQAINAGVQFLSKDYEIMILIADDIEIIMQGFDSFITEDMQKYFPDYEGCLHYPDGISQVGDRQITVPVIGHSLLKRFGYIYHGSYISDWADNEMLETYKFIGKHKYISRQIFLHKHPVWRLTEWDELYHKNESFYNIDKENYFKRLAINFNL